MKDLGTGIRASDIEDAPSENTIFSDALYHAIFAKDKERFLSVWHQYATQRAKTYIDEGQDVPPMRDEFGLRKQALLHFDRDVAEAIFSSIEVDNSSGTYAFDTKTFSEMVGTEPGNWAKNEEISPEALAFVIQKQKQEPERDIILFDKNVPTYIYMGSGQSEKNDIVRQDPIAELVTLAFSSPLLFHKPLRNVLEREAPEIVQRTLKSPKTLARALSGWGGRRSDAVNPDTNLDEDFIQRIFPQLDDIWLIMLQATDGVKHKPKNIHMWSMLIDRFPAISESLDRHATLARKQNQTRWEIISEQWGERGPLKSDLHDAYGLGDGDLQNRWSTTGAQTWDCTHYPSWFVHFYCPEPENEKTTKRKLAEEGLVKPPARLHENMGLFFLWNKERRRRKSGMEDLLDAKESNKKIKEHVLSFEGTPFVLNTLTGLTQEQFFNIVRQKHLSEWNQAGMTVGYYFAWRFKPTSLAFAQTLKKMEPQWFEDGKIISIMKDNGMSPDNVAKLERANIRKDLKERGVKIATKATKKPARKM